MDENDHTENLLNGEIMVDSEFFYTHIRNQTAELTGRTGKLLHSDEQDESCGLLDLEAEKVDDADYLLQSIVAPEGQVCHRYSVQFLASYKLTGHASCVASIFIHAVSLFVRICWPKEDLR